MYTWIGAACSSRYTGFCSLHCRRPRVAETLDGREILGQHRRGPHASTNSPIQQHVRNHQRPSLCQCPVCSALSARRDGDIDPIFDSYPRRSWPGAFAGTTRLGHMGTYPHSPLVGHLLARGHGHLSRSEKAGFYHSSIHPPISQRRQSNLFPLTVCGRAAVPVHVYLLLVGLVCVPAPVVLHAHVRVPIYDSSQSGSPGGRWSSQGRRGFQCIKGPALLSRLISLPPAAPIVFAFRGQRGSQSTASGGEPASSRRPIAAARCALAAQHVNLAGLEIFHCNLPRGLVHQIICIALFPLNLSKPALQLQLGAPTIRYRSCAAVLPLSYSANLGGRQN